MSTVAALPRLLALAVSAVLACVAVPAGAQDFPDTNSADVELWRALIWTGHLNLMNKGDPLALYKKAGQDWQKTKKHAVTDQLSADERSELLAAGNKVRDSFGWTLFEDKSVDFSVGVPTRLLKLHGSHPQDFSTFYDFEGSIGFNLLTRYSDINCLTMKRQLDLIMKATAPGDYHQSGPGWYEVAQQKDGMLTFGRALCHRSGIVFAAVNILESMAPQQLVLFSAMADSLRVGRNFNPTAIPRPHIEERGPDASDLFTASASTTKAPDAADKAGTTEAIKRETRSGPDLTVEQIFEKVSPAVYMVHAGDRMGSAVAIAEHELLTNCHVV
ncbi:MAG: hypothetical protein JOY81_13435, partial [Alphaproteobacteria bacterium]|nr:hypothetical protein [Alphaproteobacteria bacterium]